jgi:TPR repeat protein
VDVLITRAEKGDAEAQFQLGYAYDKGQGVTADFWKALSWWRKAADQGHKSTSNPRRSLLFFDPGLRRSIPLVQ